VAIVGTIAAKNNILGSLPIGSLSSYKYMIVGAAIAAVGVLVIPAIDKNTEVTIFDLAMAVAFVAALYLIFMSYTEVSSQPFKLLLLACVVPAAGLLVRAVCYNKGKAYTNSANKMRTYFKEVYDAYDVTLPIAGGAILVVLFGLSAAIVDGNNPVVSLVSKIITPSDTIVTVASVLSLVLIVALIALTLVFRKFNSTKVEKVDWILIAMLFASTFSIPYLVINMINGGMDALTSETMLLVALIANIVMFLYAAAVQFIRLRNFDPLYSVITAQYQAPKKEEEEVVEEETEEEEVVQEPASDDPFALTEEDEALYASIYGPDEEEEEEAVEEVVEEVVEEEVYEEEVVEEVVEEPAAEVTEEDEDEETEDEEIDDEEVEDEEIDDEEIEEVYEEVKKEAGVIVNDFTLVDEEGKPKKIKRKFNSKMMFAPYETKEYYNEIKNYLMMYRAKGRYSSRCETFRYKGLVAKVALGGKSIKVFLALDTDFVNQYPKYHLKDVSDKKQYVDVPVMIKVRSQRGLKYFKELVDIMMATRLVKPKRNYQPTNYLPLLIPNGEAILATLGMSTDYLHPTMNVRGIPDEMPNDLIDYIPMIPADPLEEEEVEASIYLDTLCNHFDDGAEITLDILKSLHIVNKGNVLRIRARGTLDRKLVIYAEKFDEDALKMLMCTSCTAVRIIRD
ncbi:MAG: hypothetical protein IJA65_05575, partial [Acholeplasmatales bacterium]|nr:hypothetical protein [Acholeplasmatales bacterium]